MEECRQLLQSAERFREAAAAAEQRRVRIRDAMAHATSRIQRLRSSHAEQAGYGDAGPHGPETSANEGSWARRRAPETRPHDEPVAQPQRTHATATSPHDIVEQGRDGSGGVGSGAKGSQWPGTEQWGAASRPHSGANGTHRSPQWHQTPSLGSYAPMHGPADAQTPLGSGLDRLRAAPADASRRAYSGDGRSKGVGADGTASPPRQAAVVLSRESAERVRVAAPSPSSQPLTPPPIPQYPNTPIPQARALADEANPALRRYVLSLESALAESRAREQRLQAQLGALQRSVRESAPAGPPPPGERDVGARWGGGEAEHGCSRTASATPARRVTPVASSADETDRRLAIQRGLPNPPRRHPPAAHATRSQWQPSSASRSPGEGPRYGRYQSSHVPSPPRHQTATALAARVRRLEQSLAGSLRVADLR